ncbi:MAG: hypothetical protein K9G11_02360 [Rickettsiaceae bacterium]|nr:hypothetical protein [Rickettsiaceae bacterium]
MKDNGVIVNSLSLSHEDYIKSLKNKIIEEAQEIADSENLEELIEEIGDLFEVMHSLIEANNIKYEAIEQIRVSKNLKKGTFDKDCYVESVEINDNDAKTKEYIDYYLNRATKYPQIK